MHFEPTGIQQFQLCPYKYYLQRVKGFLPERPNASLVRGRIGHDVMTHGMGSFDDLFNAAMTYHKSGDDPEFEKPLEISIEDELSMKEELRHICNTCFMSERMRGAETVRREYTIDFFLRPRSVKYDFQGTVDHLFTLPDTPNGMVEVADYKFGRRQSESQINRNLQMGLYYYGLRQNGYKINRFFWVKMDDFKQRKRTTKHGVAGELFGPGFYPIKIVDGDIPYIEKMVGRACAIINYGMFTQNSYGPAAPCAYCDVKKHCKRFKIGATD